MKSKLIGSTLLTMAALAIPTSAMALKPGQYNLVGIQQICLTSTGSWYYTTYSSGGGRWANVSQPNRVKALIWGGFDNHAGLTGRDNIEVISNQNVNWNEWTDDFSVQILNQGTLTFVKKTCDAPAAPSRRSTTAPAQKK